MTTPPGAPGAVAAPSAREGRDMASPHGQCLANACRRGQGRALPLFVALLAMGLLVSACAGGPLNRPAPERRLYNLSAARPEAAPPARDGSMLKVRPLRISPAFQGKEFVYRLDEVSYEQDYYNAFFTQPSQNLTQAAREWLGRSGVFSGVADSTSQVADTHLLEGMVTALYGDFRDRGAPKAVLEAQFFLLRNMKDTYAVAFSKTYRKAIPFPAGRQDASGLAEAFDRALVDVLSELEQDLRRSK